MQKTISQQYQNWKDAITEIFKLTSTDVGFNGAIGTNHYKKTSLIYLVRGGYVVKTPIGHGQNNFKWNKEKPFSSELVDYVCTEHTNYKRASRKDNGFKSSRENLNRIKGTLDILFCYLKYCKCSDELEQDYLSHLREEIEVLL